MRSATKNGRRVRTAVGMTCGALLVACTTAQTTSPGVIGLDRTQRFSTLVSETELTQGAEQAYTQILGKARQEGALNTDASMTRRVRAIAERIIPTVDAFRPDALGWDWQVNVIESDELNAWAMPGGKIAFYSGIIEKLQLTDAEIAAIMGHEIAHALREHSRERASSQALANLGTTALAIGGAVFAGIDPNASSQAAQLAYQTTFGLPNSRAHETEADRVGIELMARAGYDPQAAIQVWRKMDELSGGGGGPQFLSTHPSNDSRIQDLTRYSRIVAPLYRRADKAPT